MTLAPITNKSGLLLNKKNINIIKTPNLHSYLGKPYDNIWKGVVPSKIEIFAGLLLLTYSTSKVC
jgi:hypothetical protein